MKFLREVDISNKEDLLEHCEIRYDCVSIIEKLDEYDIIENALKYFDELQYNCDDIYNFFIFDVDDFMDVVKLLNSEGFLSDEKMEEIEEEEGAQE